ncbi:hypothetical protein LXL04_031835 [Taraxacum kok-saghyz]
MHLLYLYLVLTSLVTGATSPPHHHNRVVIKFEEAPDGNTKVSISQHEDSGILAAGGFTGPRELWCKCKYNLASVIGKPKDVVSGNFQEQAKVVDGTVGELTDPKIEPLQKLWENVKVIGEQAIKEVAGKSKSAALKTLGTFRIGCVTAGTLKDSALKMEQWDLIDSPKRIGEDIESNASRKLEQGVEEVKETVEMVNETSLHDLLKRFTRKLTSILADTIQSVISWCHLLGFSTAFGMGVWVTFFSSGILGKCIPKRRNQMIVSKLYVVYFRAMTLCVGTALIGYVVSRGRKVFSLSNKMEIFQGFNLLSALIMSLINTMFLEPRITKLVEERIKMKEKSGIKSVAGKKLKKLNTYSSKLNVSTMVVLTWHLAYVGPLLEAGRRP